MPASFFKDLIACNAKITKGTQTVASTVSVLNVLWDVGGHRGSPRGHRH